MTGCIPAAASAAQPLSVTPQNRLCRAAGVAPWKGGDRRHAVRLGGGGGSSGGGVGGTDTPITPTIAPTITTQPAAQTVTAGQTASFTVAASGTGPFTYQWQKNGTNSSDASTRTYTTPATTIEDDGTEYSVVVGNSADKVSSNKATLTVTAAAVAPATSPCQRTGWGAPAAKG
ncbi:MAG: immunoglobulin domain-containing protein [Rhodoferax sp.]|nr:immunoglobulin domain-containing protein [Rhodoferax sp.]